MFWDEREITLRRYLSETFRLRIADTLWNTNPAWKMVQIEAPVLIPSSLLNPEYTEDDVFSMDNLSLRPETTASSYEYARNLLTRHEGYKLPLCVWQVGKSFRREQDQPTKFMRLKEFYQQEFQCIFTADSHMDYHQAVLESIHMAITNALGCQTRVVESDRLPSYSRKTWDVEVDTGDRFMEVVSVSLRDDFGPIQIQTKKGLIQKDTLVAEVAIGLDRCIYNSMGFRAPSE